jgi:hypothetical protein
VAKPVRMRAKWRIRWFDETRLHQLHCVGLELRRELPSFPLRHEQLLAHLRAFGGVHETGGGSFMAWPALPSPVRRVHGRRSPSPAVTCSCLHSGGPNGNLPRAPSTQVGPPRVIAPAQPAYTPLRRRLASSAATPTRASRLASSSHDRRPRRRSAPPPPAPAPWRAPRPRRPRARRRRSHRVRPWSGVVS